MMASMSNYEGFKKQHRLICHPLLNEYMCFQQPRKQKAQRKESSMAANDGTLIYGTLINVVTKRMIDVDVLVLLRNVFDTGFA